MGRGKQRADSVYLFRQKGAEGPLLLRYLLRMNSLRHGGPVSCVDPAVQQACGALPQGLPALGEKALLTLLPLQPLISLPPNQPLISPPPLQPLISLLPMQPHISHGCSGMGGLRARVGCTLSALCHRPQEHPLAVALMHWDLLFTLGVSLRFGGLPWWLSGRELAC